MKQNKHKIKMSKEQIGCGKKFNWAKCEKHICGEEEIYGYKYLCPECKVKAMEEYCIKDEIRFLKKLIKSSKIIRNDSSLETIEKRIGKLNSRLSKME